MLHKTIPNGLDESFICIFYTNKCQIIALVCYIIKRFHHTAGFDEICISIDKERNSRTALNWISEQFTAEPLISSCYHMVPQAKWSISTRKLGFLDVSAGFFSPTFGEPVGVGPRCVGADSLIFHKWALEKSTFSTLWWVAASSYAIQTGTDLKNQISSGMMHGGRAEPFSSGNLVQLDYSPILNQQHWNQWVDTRVSCWCCIEGPGGSRFWRAPYDLTVLTASVRCAELLTWRFGSSITRAIAVFLSYSGRRCANIWADFQHRQMSSAKLHVRGRVLLKHAIFKLHIKLFSWEKLLIWRYSTQFDGRNLRGTTNNSRVQIETSHKAHFESQTKADPPASMCSRSPNHPATTAAPLLAQRGLFSTTLTRVNDGAQSIQRQKATLGGL